MIGSAATLAAAALPVTERSLCSPQASSFPLRFFAGVPAVSSWLRVCSVPPGPLYLCHIRYNTSNSSSSPAQPTPSEACRVGQAPPCASRACPVLPAGSAFSSWPSVAEPAANCGSGPQSAVPSTGFYCTAILRPKGPRGFYSVFAQTARRVSGSDCVLHGLRRARLGLLRTRLTC